MSTWNHVGGGRIADSTGKHIGQFIGDFKDRDHLICAVNEIESLRAENEALKQQVEQGKRDAERLDYLQQGVTIDLWGKALLFRVGGIYSTLNKSIREAIDAAIAAAPKQEK